MKALTVIPKRPDSAELSDIGEPDPAEGAVLVQTLAVGICGTDLELVAGEYGWAPPGHERLVLGHESLGRVLEAPDGTGLSEGDLVVGIVRQPDPEPCPNCAVGEWDMCRNGNYTEHGIKELDGFARERYRIAPEFAVRLDPPLEQVGMLLEPASVLAKAWEHTEAIGRRARWEPRTVLITGAGPIGLLGALMGAQRGLEVHVLNRSDEPLKRSLVEDLGGTFHTGRVQDTGVEADVVIECTGVPQVVFDAIENTAAGGVMCLTGVSPSGRHLTIDAGALNTELVLQNDAIFGSVNANRRHYEQGAQAMADAEAAWLERLITRRVPLERWQEALRREPGDVKAVLELAS